MIFDIFNRQLLASRKDSSYSSCINQLQWLDDSHMASRWAMAAIDLVQEGLAGGILLFNEVVAVHRAVWCKE